MKLHYRELGDGDPVFIFHGLFGMNDNWQSFGKSLAESGYKVILADLRNHGHSPHADEHDYAGMAEDIFELIEYTGYTNPVLIGHSMGGKAVMKLLNEHPGIAKKAVIVDIAPWAYPSTHNRVVEALKAVKPDLIKSRKGAEDILSPLLQDSGTLQFLLKNLYRTGPDSFAWRFNLDALIGHISGIGEDVFPSSPVQTPVLFIRGESSNYIDPTRKDEIMQHFPLAVFENIEGAGHWVHADKPVELLRCILDFSKKQPAAGNQ